MGVTTPYVFHNVRARYSGLEKVDHRGRTRELARARLVGALVVRVAIVHLSRQSQLTASSRRFVCNI
jgi:hypothetical protein